MPQNALPKNATIHLHILTRNCAPRCHMAPLCCDVDQDLRLIAIWDTVAGDLRHSLRRVVLARSQDPGRALRTERVGACESFYPSGLTKPGRGPRVQFHRFWIIASMNQHPCN